MIRVTRKVLTNAELLEVLQQKKKEGLGEFKKKCFSEKNLEKSEKVINKRRIYNKYQ